MVELIRHIPLEKFNPIIFVLADSDKTSAPYLEKNLDWLQIENIKFIRRSRSVGQSYVSSVFTTILSFFDSLSLVFKEKPQLVLSNGPGTCIPICLSSFLFNVFGIISSRIVFIESFCRVENLSLSGKIMMFFGDHFIVPWPELLSKNSNAKYLGQLF